MSDRFETFTESARKVLTLALQESMQLNQHYIGPEHLLLALLDEKNGVAARVLTQFGLGALPAREKIQTLTGSNQQRDPWQGEIILNEQGRQVIEWATEEARQLNHHYIGTEHLLLGLLHLDSSEPAIRVITDQGVKPEAVREAIVSIISQSTYKSPATPPTTPTRKLGDVAKALENAIKQTLGGDKEPEQPPIKLNTDKTLDFMDSYKFTERARKVLDLAAAEAQRFNHNFIGTEHLLLGLVREGEGVAAQVLNNLGVELDKVRAAVEFIIGRGDRVVGGMNGLTPRSKRVVELAVDEARRLDHHYVGTEHLLLGLVREGEGIAAGVLASLGVELEKVRQNVIQVLSQNTYTGPNKMPTTTEVQTNRLMSSFSLDLTELARKKQLDPVVERDAEIDRVIQILIRYTINSAILVGEQKVGKTTVIEGLAQRLASDETPYILHNKPLTLVDLDALLANYAKDKAQLISDLEKFIAAVRSNKAILTVPRIHRLLEADAPEIKAILKMVLIQDNISLIATTTPTYYEQYVEKDAVFQEYCHKVVIAEPTAEQTLRILEAVKPLYEKHHGVTYKEKALQAVVDLSAKYLTDRRQPHKAVDLLDEIGVQVRMRQARTEDKSNIATRQDIIRAVATLTGLSEDKIS